jgi:nitrogen fixation protein NifB
MTATTHTDLGGHAPTATKLARNEHPCFDEAARARTARVHLPVAPKCNVQCNYCNRKFDCVSESRPGVSSTVLSPTQAADYVDTVRAELPNLAVVGIAGPGDPFANPDATLTSLELVKDRHPDLLLCVSSNGLALANHLDALAELDVSHVTITMNTVDPEVGGQIYRWVRDGRQVYRGREAGELILARQLASIVGLKARGITVKINTILVPGVTLDGIADVAKVAGSLGADTMNNLPLYPVERTPFGALRAPTTEEITIARRASEPHIEQMTHCQRCRADAVGILGEEHAQTAIDRLLAAKAPAKQRPYIAVCSQEGYLVNQHLGGAEHLLIYENTNIDGMITPQLIDKRRTPAAGGGAGRWAMLAGVISDCKALITHQLGGTPRMVLTGAGISVYESDGLICEAVADVFAGRSPRRALPARSCETDCSGPGDACA